MSNREQSRRKSSTVRKVSIGFALLISALFLSVILSVIALRWVNPPFTHFTLQENWEELPGERYSLRDYWVEYEEIPEHLIWAVIAAEDQLFWEHRGFDMESIREAWEEKQSGVRVRGASTISQQVAKNIYLTPAQSLVRKGIEAGFTVLIELFWPKERIMEVYLNIAEFGPGIFGAGKAAQEQFSMSLQEIEPEMAARMAAVLPSPKRMRVNPPSPFAEERSGWILRQMTQLSGIGYYTPPPGEPEEDPAASIDPLQVNPEFLETAGGFIGMETTKRDTTPAGDEIDFELDIEPLIPIENDTLRLSVDE